MKRARFLALAMSIGWILVGCGDDVGSMPDAASEANPEVGVPVDSQAGPGLDAGAAMDGAASPEPVDSGAPGTTLGAPSNVSVAPGDTPGTAKVLFTPSTSSMPGMTLSYVVTASPGAISASGTQSPIVLAGLAPQGAYTFSIVASDGMMASAPATTGLVSFYDVVETFREPMTQPNDTIFTGSFAFDATSKVVWNLTGSLTESMTKVNGVYGGPMTTVSLANQLSVASVVLDGVSGFLVTTFALTTVDTFAGGGLAPGGTEYYGLLEGTPNNHNAYAMIFVNTTDPTAMPGQAQIDKLAYADCTAGGMMMNSCMTGTSVAGYGAKGTMGGYPLSQVITKR
jgi:hypothetical protein